MTRSTLRLLAGLLPLFVLATGSLHAAQEIRRSFPVSGPAELVLTAEGAAVSITGSSSRRDIGVTAESSVDIAENWDIRFEHHGNRLLIEAERKNGSRGFLSRLFGGFKSKALRFVIQTPEELSARVETSGGRIEMSGTSGESALHTSGGSITLEAIRGPVSAETSGGRISCEDIGGGPLRLSTSGGGMELAYIDCDFEAKTSGGPISGRELEGSGFLKTSGGGIRVDKMTGRLEAKTSGGRISVTGLDGCVNARTSGGGIDIVCITPPGGECHARTSGGGIDFTLPRDSNVNIRAETSGGKVRTDVPVTVGRKESGTFSGNSLAGEMGTGGPLVVLKTSGGGIRINPL